MEIVEKNDRLTREEIISILDFLQKQKEANNPRSYISIKNALHILSIPFPFLTISAGTPFFRIRIHDNPDDIYRNIHDIAHRNELNLITHFGRANEPLQSIFYCSDMVNTAFFETSKIARNNIDNPFEIRTIGRWVLQKDIKVAVLPVNKSSLGQNMVADGIHHRFKDLIDSYKSEGTADVEKLLELFSIEFSQKSMGSDNDYMISCAFANYIYVTNGIDIKTNEKAQVQGIMYPSVQFASEGMNLALKPELINDEILKLEVAVCQKMVRIADTEYKDSMPIVSKSIDYSNYTINWE